MKDINAESCRRLWQEVVLCAIEQAHGLRINGGSPKIVKSEADTWLRDGGKDFHMVCALAGWDSDFIRDAYVSGRINIAALRNERATLSGKDNRTIAEAAE